MQRYAWILLEMWRFHFKWNEMKCVDITWNFIAIQLERITSSWFPLKSFSIMEICEENFGRMHAIWKENLCRFGLYGIIVYMVTLQFKWGCCENEISKLLNIWNQTKDKWIYLICSSHWATCYPGGVLTKRKISYQTRKFSGLTFAPL